MKEFVAKKVYALNEVEQLLEKLKQLQLSAPVDDEIIEADIKPKKKSKKKSKKK